MSLPDHPAPPVPWWLYKLRMLPRSLPGKTRLSRLLCTLHQPSGPVQIQAQNLQFSLPSMAEPMAHALIRDGIYEPQTAEAIQRHLPRDGIFLDVGANIGIFSLMAAHHWCPNGLVVAFEASPNISQWLKKNTENNPSPALRVIHSAVTGRSGELLPFFDAPSDRFGMGALTSRFDGPVATVSTISLDDAASSNAIQQVHVIKVDVEGHELGVFQGALKILHHPNPPVIIFEFNDWAENRLQDRSKAGDAQRFLSSHGYSIQKLDDYLTHGPNPGPVIEIGSAELIAWKHNTPS
jgi:FkbM family methyltransferase